MKRRILGDVVLDGDVEALALKLRAKGFNCVITYIFDYDLPADPENSQMVSVWKDVDAVGTEEEAIESFGNDVNAIIGADGFVNELGVVPSDFVSAPGKQWPDDIKTTYKPIWQRI